jgi:hypothetical protein
MRGVWQLVPQGLILLVIHLLFSHPHRPLLSFGPTHVRVEVATAEWRYSVNLAAIILIQKNAPAFFVLRRDCPDANEFAQPRLGQRTWASPKQGPHRFFGRAKMLFDVLIIAWNKRTWLPLTTRCATLAGTSGPLKKGLGHHCPPLLLLAFVSLLVEAYRPSHAKTRLASWSWLPWTQTGCALVGLAGPTHDIRHGMPRTSTPSWL